MVAHYDHFNRNYVICIKIFVILTKGGFEVTIFDTHNSCFRSYAVILPSFKIGPNLANESVISSVFVFCPPVTLTKRSYERLAPPWKLSQIVEIRSSESFKVQQVLARTISRRGVVKKCHFLPKCPSVTGTFSHLLSKTRAWFEIPGGW